MNPDIRSANHAAVRHLSLGPKVSAIGGYEVVKWGRKCSGSAGGAQGRKTSGNLKPELPDFRARRSFEAHSVSCSDSGHEKSEVDRSRRGLDLETDCAPSATLGIPRTQGIRERREPLERQKRAIELGFDDV